MVKLDLKSDPCYKKTCSRFRFALHFHMCFGYRKYQSYFSPWKLLRKTFVMMNDTSNSDVKIYAMI